MPAVKRLRWSATIDAPVANVVASMIDPDGYRDWTSVFAEGSYYEGSWQQGDTIRFLSPKGEGIVAEIAEHRPNAFISIRHLGFTANGVDDFDSEAVRAWAPAYENYTFEPTATGTTLTVELDVTEDFEKYMTDTWPKALDRLKALCESGSARA